MSGVSDVSSGAPGNPNPGFDPAVDGIKGDDNSAQLDGSLQAEIDKNGHFTYKHMTKFINAFNHQFNKTTVFGPATNDKVSFIGRAASNVTNRLNQYRTLEQYYNPFKSSQPKSINYSKLKYRATKTGFSLLGSGITIAGFMHMDGPMIGFGFCMAIENGWNAVFGYDEEVGLP
ncbi:MAG: hypothetical protein L3J69_17045 [Desulfobacula sp.]|nr:hypothetical protein [Desulfobacula sp.]